LLNESKSDRTLTFNISGYPCGIYIMQAFNKEGIINKQVIKN